MINCSHIYHFKIEFSVTLECDFLNIYLPFQMIDNFVHCDFIYINKGTVSYARNLFHRTV